MLSGIAKKIIVSRLYDRGIQVSEYELDTYLINADDFQTNNDMYDFIVNNWGCLVIN